MKKNPLNLYQGNGKDTLRTVKNCSDPPHADSGYLNHLKSFVFRRVSGALLPMAAWAASHLTHHLLVTSGEVDTVKNIPLWACLMSPQHLPLASGGLQVSTPPHFSEEQEMALQKRWCLLSGFGLRALESLLWLC